MKIEKEKQKRFTDDRESRKSRHPFQVKAGHEGDGDGGKEQRVRRKLQRIT